MSRPNTAVLAAAFAALSDTTRREMIRSLLHKPRRAGELADLVYQLQSFKTYAENPPRQRKPKA